MSAVKKTVKIKIIKDSGVEKEKKEEKSDHQSGKKITRRTKIATSSRGGDKAIKKKKTVISMGKKKVGGSSPQKRITEERPKIKGPKQEIRSKKKPFPVPVDIFTPDKVKVDKPTNVKDSTAVDSASSGARGFGRRLSESPIAKEAAMADRSAGRGASKDWPEKKKERGFIKKDADFFPLGQEQDKKKEAEAKEAIGGGSEARRSIKLYRKIALSFIFLTLALLAVIFYFSFIKATIILIPNQERMSNNMIIDVYDSEKNKDQGANSIGGIVRLIDIEHTNTYSVSGVEVIGEEVTGTVKIVNNYIKNQPLVATTRLLTSDNKLFRIKKTVNVPAGGSIETEIYADKPGPDMAIGSTKFTIPGLWAGLQDKIYAENSQAIIYKQKVKKHITQTDIDNSIGDLRQGLLVRAKSDISETYKDYGQVIYQIDENSVMSEVLGKAGEEKDEFTASIKAKVVVVGFDNKQAAALAKQRFISLLPKNKDLISFDENNVTCSLGSYNYSEGLASINAVFEGQVSLKEDSDIVEVDKILGLNKDQLDAYLASLPEIAGFEVKFSPSFIKKVPKLVDRVEIVIKK